MRMEVLVSAIEDLKGSRQSNWSRGVGLPELLHRCPPKSHSVILSPIAGAFLFLLLPSFFLFDWL